MRPSDRQATSWDRPVGLVLSGGGARGAFQVGVWDVLRHDPRGLGAAPAVVSGSSAGSINAALIGAGLGPDAMLEFWIQLGREPPIRANTQFFRSLERAIGRTLLREPLRSAAQRRRGARILGRLLRSHPLHRSSGWASLTAHWLLTARFDSLSSALDRVESCYLFSTDPFRTRLAEAFGGPEITEPCCRLAINTVDIRTGQVVRFVSHAPHVHDDPVDEAYRHAPIHVDMVVASASIPLLFDPVTVGQTELWDGGLLVNTPIAPAVALGARAIVPVLVTAGRAGSPTGPLSFGQAIERVADAFLENAYNADRKLLLERNEVARIAPERGLAVVDLHEAIRPRSARVFDAGSYLYFEPSVLEEMYAAGREAARDWLARGARLDPGVARSAQRPR